MVEEDEPHQEAQEAAPVGRKRLGFCWGRHGNDFIFFHTRPRNERELVRLPFPPLFLSFSLLLLMARV
jgi:hypothetical protein